MVASAYQYLSSLIEPYGLLRTLSDVRLCRDNEGQPVCSVGNSAAVFKATVGDRICALRCYTRPKRNLRAIYREALLPAELFVYTDDNSGEWCDVVIGDWIEGITLQTAIASSFGDCAAMQQLADDFDALACKLLAQEWAHGDVKPENIIIDTTGGMHLIDFDAMWRPGFASSDCEESGTRAYQHPDRTEVFGKEIDDYPIALISTSLHALALNPTLQEDTDSLPVSPEKAVAGTDTVLERIEQMFASSGDALHYRIARLLHSPQPKLHRLAEFLHHTQERISPNNRTLHLAEQGGLWGYCDDEGLSVIPPIYDCGFEFGDDRAAVRIGDKWHFIDTAGNVAINCADCDAVKPFRNGIAEKIVGNRRTKIDKTGKEIG
ncbi:MAG: WG repeat-containing protein [Alistipes sp.]